MARHTQAEDNLAKLRQNVYPGRGLVVGMNDAGSHVVQVYWIMGRSENSRNRVFVSDDAGSLRTAPADPAKIKDASLIIYNAMRHVGPIHVASNGDQTDDVIIALEQAAVGEYVFFDCLSGREYEPDAPNFTPRITLMSMSVHGRPIPTAQISILRKSQLSEACDHFLFSYEELPQGLGYCVTTYSGDGNPLPSFSGEPYLLPLSGSIEEIASELWWALDENNKVSLAVKFIDIQTDESVFYIVNKYTTVTV